MLCVLNLWVGVRDTHTPEPHAVSEVAAHPCVGAPRDKPYFAFQAIVQRRVKAKARPAEPHREQRHRQESQQREDAPGPRGEPRDCGGIYAMAPTKRTTEAAAAGTSTWRKSTISRESATRAARCAASAPCARCRSTRSEASFA
jgi:hypothetical protein